MILGIGNDIVDIRRIQDNLNKYSSRFEERIFTSAERKHVRCSKNIAHNYAKRFAAKEAFSKALGTGIRGLGATVERCVEWTDMSVVNNIQGRPDMILTGCALKIMKEITPKGMDFMINVSLSSETDYAIACVVLSSIPKEVY